MNLSNLTSPIHLPYFEGDFWPNVIEEQIKELDQELEEERRAIEACDTEVRTYMLQKHSITLFNPYLCMYKASGNLRYLRMKIGFLRMLSV